MPLYMPTSAIVILGQQCTPVSNTDADTSEATLYSLTIPAGTVGPHDSLEVWPIWSGSTSGSVAKTGRIKLGGVTVATHAMTGSGIAFAPITVIAARASTASQVTVATAGPGAGSSSSIIVTSTVDMTAEQTLTITSQWASAGSGSFSHTLGSVRVRLIRGV